jgi:hypothetical protein
LEIKAGCNEISKEKRTDYGELTRRISKWSSVYFPFASGPSRMSPSGWQQRTSASANGAQIILRMACQNGGMLRLIFGQELLIKWGIHFIWHFSSAIIASRLAMDLLALALYRGKSWKNNQLYFRHYQFKPLKLLGLLTNELIKFYSWYIIKCYYVLSIFCLLGSICMMHCHVQKHHMTERSLFEHASPWPPFAIRPLATSE